MSWIEIRQCPTPSCRLRFPATSDERRRDRCPICGAATTLVLTQSAEAENRQPATSYAQSPLRTAILDNIRSTFNVGSIFRCADGVGIEHLYLCGITPTPDHPKVAKTALGAEQSVGWSQHNNALDLAAQLHKAGHQLWALEENNRAEALWNVSLPATPASITLIIGNEVAGVDPELLLCSDRVVAIPMRGAKRSLNVAIAFGIAAYWLCAS